MTQTYTAVIQQAREELLVSLKSGLEDIVVILFR